MRATTKLSDIRTRLAKHPAFQNVSCLEALARKYHCELNFIEGLGCDMKKYARKSTDQTFPTMMRLIPQSRPFFIERNIEMKLFRRFWKALSAYHQETLYAEVLCLFYSRSCKSEVESHRKVSSTKLHH